MPTHLHVQRGRVTVAKQQHQQQLLQFRRGGESLNSFTTPTSIAQRVLPPILSGELKFFHDVYVDRAACPAKNNIRRVEIRSVRLR
ncbi:hypothetical protein NDU88_007007 [Pleurodeles waltl]|uniref:Uncharacterized protein n=1 Tax=Pleurodeles waltl TaxID=8319 RepID=A0AAV7SRA7_PLEWA|nr:hypothetical protein NDU88_007007 [Pleurodeles waltl]